MKQEDNLDQMLWSLKETAHQLGDVSVRTVERMIEAGEFPCVRVRRSKRIPKLAVQKWLDQQLQPSDSEGDSACYTEEKTPLIGGSVTAHQAARKLAKVAGLPTMPKPKHLKSIGV